MNEQSSQQSKEKNWLRSFFVILIVVIVIWSIAGFLPVFNSIPGFNIIEDSMIDSSLSGQFGDSFGWINSLFSALAFAGIIITILMQRDELRMQREELRNQITELKNQHEELKNQREELAKTREQHENIVKLQEDAGKRQLLSDYVSQMTAIQEINQWKLSKEYKDNSHKNVDGLFVQFETEIKLKKSIMLLTETLKDHYPKLLNAESGGSRYSFICDVKIIHTSIKAGLKSADDLLADKMRLQIDELRKFAGNLNDNSNEISAIIKRYEEVEKNRVPNNKPMSDIKKEYKLILEQPLATLITNQIKDFTELEK